ncbi:hypothetical protein I2486_21645 [Cellulophaga sp. E16_2]|uniref:Uncharacterized protein n=1 Tax=Cellulophaga algicola (strain DSM 14237 / IC166 / ACAM 630) TaxID=688270 RepID=E6X608_CELAD|nr:MULTISPECIES: hypothetical protein [Cellulophaga]ADV50567.1 hypothetical protein Celal_3301 [Cellulophaga algicola DSM 14237]ADV50588.1 hypothetical protein Celal_3322 [Cellulophaga algicola DSM 14237]MBO0594013.1 hypothetical protein [Cellulophaga sp. E16_2]
MVDKLNSELSSRIKNEYEKTKAKIENISSDKVYIQKALNIYSEYDMNKYKASITQSIKENSLTHWKDHQSNDERELFDCILFEYSDQETPPFEAYSHALSELQDFKISIEPYYFQTYELGYWDAGVGINLNPFEICKPYHISEIGSDEWDIIYDDAATQNDIQIINEMARRISKLILNDVFAEFDNQGLFDWLKLRPGGLFMFDVHDGGNVTDPFYLKK